VYIHGVYNVLEIEIKLGKKEKREYVKERGRKKKKGKMKFKRLK
jgi:hypothetical protein